MYILINRLRVVTTEFDLGIPFGTKGYKNVELAEHLDRALQTRANSTSVIVKGFHLASTYFKVHAPHVVHVRGAIRHTCTTCTEHVCAANGYHYVMSLYCRDNVVASTQIWFLNIV